VADVDINEDQITPLLERFYERVRQDSELGPVFEIVADWDEHIERLTDFWSSVMLTTGRYKGNPLAMHIMHAEKIRPEMFDRWLAIWKLTTEEVLPANIANEMQSKAARIASRLSLALSGRQPTAREADIQPYRTTPVFEAGTLPPPLLRNHSLKSDTWGVLRVLDGAVNYVVTGQAAMVVERGLPGIIEPDIEHHLEIIGPVKLQIEFYDRNPVASIN